MRLTGITKLIFDRELIEQVLRVTMLLRWGIFCHHLAFHMLDFGINCNKMEFIGIDWNKLEKIGINWNK